MIHLAPLSIFGYSDPAQPGAIYVYTLGENAADGQLQLLSGHSKWVGTVAFLAGGAQLLSLGNDNTMRWWDLSSGRLRRASVGRSVFVVFS